MKLVNCRDVYKDDSRYVYIGRPGYFGNPFRMKDGSDEERLKVIEDYKIWFEKRILSDFIFRQKILELRGHDLSCWCSPKPCHGDVIIEWLQKHKEK